ncbi:hypothetical protein P168DRAFT_98437 [Aspergillus campestris IBT 28561]|uniref:Uncharacterized protein n=1 Tax=Aspergillus campestris (strain IBT 28561) TaxID=1392248 RepID=A0A2I1DCI0_ASPC2|nr:uncharacterized protein P168DRAFT_98437 [Aspergillus campestris IBT 28561]PKY07587.1 hypothetical protein P168DRAFT_98437 [Aspergillus campestris IBT 28561]
MKDPLSKHNQLSPYAVRSRESNLRNIESEREIPRHDGSIRSPAAVRHGGRDLQPTQGWMILPQNGPTLPRPRTVNTTSSSLPVYSVFDRFILENVRRKMNLLPRLLNRIAIGPSLIMFMFGGVILSKTNNPARSRVLRHGSEPWNHGISPGNPNPKGPKQGVRGL